MNGPTRDDRVERTVGTLLRWGVLLAAAVTACGGLLLLGRAGGQVVGAEAFRAEPTPLTAIAPLFGDAVRSDASAVILVGVILLIATPIARVAATLVAFAYQKDRSYVVIAALVLALLAYSLLSGAGIG